MFRQSKIQETQAVTLRKKRLTQMTDTLKQYKTIKEKRFIASWALLSGLTKEKIREYLDIILDAGLIKIENETIKFNFKGEQ